jgi:hypothetical protein
MVKILLSILIAINIYANDIELNKGWYVATVMEGKLKNYEIYNTLVFENNIDGRERRVTIYNTNIVVYDCGYDGEYIIYSHRKDCK